LSAWRPGPGIDWCGGVKPVRASVRWRVFIGDNPKCFYRFVEDRQARARQPFTPEEAEAIERRTLELVETQKAEGRVYVHPSKR
jgi:hypothetical protein